MGESNSVTDHINDFNIILVQFVLMQITIEHKVKPLILLSSPPDSRATIITIVSSSVRDNKLSLMTYEI